MVNIFLKSFITQFAITVFAFVVAYTIYSIQLPKKNFLSIPDSGYIKNTSEQSLEEIANTYDLTLKKLKKFNAGYEKNDKIIFLREFDLKEKQVILAAEKLRVVKVQIQSIPEIGYIHAEAGQTLAFIAERYGLSPTELASLNPNDKANTQRIVFLENIPELKRKIILAQVFIINDANIHILKRGDYLSTIARKYATVSNYEKIGEINQLSNTNNVPIGQKLIIDEKALDYEMAVYLVKSGETLEGIAKDFGIKKTKLQQLNNNINNVTEGDYIIIFKY